MSDNVLTNCDTIDYNLYKNCEPEFDYDYDRQNPLTREEATSKWLSSMLVGDDNQREDLRFLQKRGLNIKSTTSNDSTVIDSSNNLVASEINQLKYEDVIRMASLSKLFK